MAKIERTKNASRNIIFGLVLRIYQLLVPFLMRTAMISFMGIQYLGLNSLFVSVLQVLNLAELGVGSAMVYSMYKPIAEDNNIKICALMKLYRTYYAIIGAVIAFVGVILTPFIPKLINGDVPHGINIKLLYLLNLSATVLSYWLLAYKNSILQAHQRIDVISKVTLVTNTIQYVLQFFVLWFFRNYYYYVIVMLITQVLTNVITAYYSDKIYPQFKPVGNLGPNEIKIINKRIADLFTSRLGGVVVNSVDTIVISAFLGLAILAVYQNYYYIVTAVIGIVAVVYTSVTAGIGNSLVVETKEKNFNDLIKFTFIICWIAGVCSCCLLNLFQPFMELWVGKNLMLDLAAVICFVAYYYVYEINQLLNTYKDAGGIWHEDRFRPLLTAIVNVFLNLIMVKKIGIYGIILSTVLSMVFVGMPWLIYNLFTTMFPNKLLTKFLHKLLSYIAISIMAIVISYYISSFVQLSPLPTFIIRGIICVIVPNIIFIFAYKKQDEFKQSIVLINKITNGKFKRILKEYK